MVKPRVDMVVYEEVRAHIGRSSGSSKPHFLVDAAHVYGGLQAHLLALCEEHSIPVEAVPVGTIKKHATGKGNANKDTMTVAGHRILVETKSVRRELNSDEADAICLLSWALKEYGS